MAIVEPDNHLKGTYVDFQFKNLSDIAILFKNGILIAGIKFWKVGSRKLFSISTEVLGPRSVDAPTQMKTLLNEKLYSLDSKVSKILKVAPYYKVPLGLLAQLHDTFICKSSPYTLQLYLPNCMIHSYANRHH